MSPNTKKKIQFFASLFVTLLLFYFVFRSVDFRKVIPPILAIDPAMVVLLLVMSVFFNVIVYCDRWQRMLGFLGRKHTLKETVVVHFGTGALHLLLPIQAGEAVTAYALAKKQNGPLALYLGTILYGKYLNLLATLAIMFGGAALAIGFSLPVTKVSIAAFGAVILAGILLETKFVRQIIEKAVGRFGDKIQGATGEILSIFEKITYPKKLFLLIYSIAFQLAEVFWCYLLFHAMGIEIPFAHTMAVVGLIILIANLPITIAGAGTREALCLLLLAPFGPKAVLVAAGILYTFGQYIWPMLVGIPWMRRVLDESFFQSEK
jgi:uncharacterized protein (TIRG00374 family)